MSLIIRKFGLHAFGRCERRVLVANELLLMRRPKTCVRGVNDFLLARNLETENFKLLLSMTPFLKANNLLNKNKLLQTSVSIASIVNSGTIYADAFCMIIFYQNATITDDQTHSLRILFVGIVLSFEFCVYFRLFYL